MKQIQNKKKWQIEPVRARRTRRRGLVLAGVLLVVVQTGAQSDPNGINQYRLAPTSPYATTTLGTDGQPAGADIDEILRATCGVVENRPCDEARPVPPPARLRIVL